MRELEREENAERNRATPSLMAAPLPSLAIVGAGRVGRAIHAGAARAGLETELAGREDAVAACRRADALLLCVPDVAISAACEELCRAAPNLRFVGHTSGSTGLDALAATAEIEAAAFGLHPLQTIPDGHADLAGAPCAVTGSSATAAAVARELAAALGMHPFELDDDARAAYHAAASIASNFLVTLEESAAELLERAGIEGSRDLLAPLVLRSAANWSERGRAALTGPIARGDEATVERHLAAIAELHPELTGLYQALAARTRRLAGEGARP
jgi:predicted short-subunit dehydrogenase-like oxidoreductase (DUF2520 family)